MRESEIIDRTGNRPITVDSLYQDLIRIGIQPGMTLLVHASLSALGWVCGGPVAVLQALQRVLGTKGTLVMPAHSGDLSDPSLWENPPVPATWWDIIREEMPAYDPDMTPTRGMGIIAETFRMQKGVLRSQHPQVSFIAHGLNAQAIVMEHGLDFGLGDASPLARLYELGGSVLLLGVGHDSNTSLHLAEYRAQYPGKREIENGAPVYLADRRQWVKLKDIHLESTDFEQIGRDYQSESGKISCGKVGLADAKLLPQRDLVEYAVEWIGSHR